MLDKNFKEFAELLNSTGVEYMVVGGYALAAYGHPRYTGDLDIWIRRTPENARRVIEALKLFGFGGLGLSEQDFLVPDAVIQLGEPLGQPFQEAGELAEHQRLVLPIDQFAHDLLEGLRLGADNLKGGRPRNSDA